MTAAGTDPLDSAIAEVENQLGSLLGRVRTQWKDYATSVHPELQPGGYKILSTLVRDGSTSAGAIADELHTDKSVISRQVRIMEGLGLVESHADASDGRAKVLVPTAVAVQRVNAVRASSQARLGELLRAWPVGDVQKLAELLDRLRF